jgi:hypothetical protein
LAGLIELDFHNEEYSASAKSSLYNINKVHENGIFETRIQTYDEQSREDSSESSVLTLTGVGGLFFI